MYDWGAKIVAFNQLEQTLEMVHTPWEVFAIVPTGANFVVVIRRPK